MIGGILVAINNRLLGDKSSKIKCLVITICVGIDMHLHNLCCGLYIAFYHHYQQ